MGNVVHQEFHFKKNKSLNNLNSLNNAGLFIEQKHMSIKA